MGKVILTPTQGRRQQQFKHFLPTDKETISMFDKALPLDVHKELAITAITALCGPLERDLSLIQEVIDWLQGQPKPVNEKDAFRIRAQVSIAGLVEFYRNQSLSQKKLKIVLRRTYPFKSRKCWRYSVWCSLIKEQMRGLMKTKPGSRHNSR